MSPECLNFEFYFHLILMLLIVVVYALQFLGVMAICTNCALLVCLYDQQGTWTLEPGMAAILLMEHILLLVKFGFSCFVPEVVLHINNIELSSFNCMLFYSNSSACLEGNAK